MSNDVIFSQSNRTFTPVFDRNITWIDDTLISDKLSWSSEKIDSTKLDKPEEEGNEDDVLTMKSGEPTWAENVATRLKTGRTIELTGNATGETIFDGSENVQIFTSISTLTNEELEAMLT